jgi:hypothetical protein
MAVCLGKSVKPCMFYKKSFLIARFTVYLTLKIIIIYLRKIILAGWKRCFVVLHQPMLSHTATNHFESRLLDEVLYKMEMSKTSVSVSFLRK